jgi:HK97 family phage prohead protease
MTMERRSIVAEVRSEAEGRKISGYGAVFDVETNIGGYFREKIASGAFSKALKGDVRSYFNHDSNNILGRTKSGTLRLSEDQNGLGYEVDLPDTQVARDLKVSMDRGDVDGSSFAFSVTRETWEEIEGELPLRTIHEVELYEVGPVTIPQYPDAKVALRSLEASKEEGEVARRNAAAAKARIAARKAETEQKIRGIK